MPLPKRKALVFETPDRGRRLWKRLGGGEIDLLWIVMPIGAVRVSNWLRRCSRKRRG